MSEALAKKIVHHMLSQDKFSEWLKIKVLKIVPGSVELSMLVRPEMVNGFGNTHGGIQYSLADSALAFSANSRGRKAVALENIISYPAPVMAGDEIKAVSEELTLGNTIATYAITIFNQHQRKVALFRGTVYRLRDEWFPEGKV